MAGFASDECIRAMAWRHLHNLPFAIDFWKQLSSIRLHMHPHYPSSVVKSAPLEEFRQIGGVLAGATLVILAKHHSTEVTTRTV